MEVINLPRSVMKRLLQNAEDYALAMMPIATPGQIEKVRKQNELSDQDLEICPDCRRESRRDLGNCEFCGQDKVPF